MSWGSHTNALDTALSLARYRGDKLEVERLERELSEARRACGEQGHAPNPERPTSCFKCGAPTAPGVCQSKPRSLAESVELNEQASNAKLCATRTA